MTRVLIVLALIITAVLGLCVAINKAKYPRIVMPGPIKQATGRFTVQREGNLWLITDRKTGEEYIGLSGCGITKVMK